MATLLTPNAIEESTYFIKVDFTDEDGNAVVPNSGLVWSLTSVAGDTVNSREDESIASAATIYICLSGNDLKLVDGKDTYRIVTVEGAYNSARGSNLPLKGSAKLLIENLVKV